MRIYHCGYEQLSIIEKGCAQNRGGSRSCNSNHLATKRKFNDVIYTSLTASISFKVAYFGSLNFSGFEYSLRFMFRPSAFLVANWYTRMLVPKTAAKTLEVGHPLSLGFTVAVTF